MGQEQGRVGTVKLLGKVRSSHHPPRLLARSLATSTRIRIDTRLCTVSAQYVLWESPAEPELAVQTSSTTHPAQDMHQCVFFPQTLPDSRTDEARTRRCGDKFSPRSRLGGGRGGSFRRHHTSTSVLDGRATRVRSSRIPSRRTSALLLGLGRCRSHQYRSSAQILVNDRASGLGDLVGSKVMSGARADVLRGCRLMACRALLRCPAVKAVTDDS